MVEPYYHILYKIENLITNEYYIGGHSTQNLTDKYFGSGSSLKENIKMYGKHNFIKKFLYFAESRKKLSEIEIQVISKHLSDPLCLNKKIGGFGKQITPNLLQERIDSGIAKEMCELYKLNITDLLSF